MQMSQAAGTEQMIPRLSRYSSESGRKLNSWLIIKLINIAALRIRRIHMFLGLLDPDPYIFGPSGSGSISRRYGFGSGSFYNQAKIVRTTLIPTVL